MKDVYLIREIGSNKYIDWYAGTYFLEANIDGIRNGYFENKEEASFFLYQKSNELPKGYYIIEKIYINDKK